MTAAEVGLKGAGDLTIRDVAGGCVIAVKATPGAARDRVVGVLGRCLKIATAAAPEKGKANKAIAAILADALGARRRDVTLLSGTRSPRKEFRVAGMTADQVRAALGRSK